MINTHVYLKPKNTTCPKVSLNRKLRNLILKRPAQMAYKKRKIMPKQTVAGSCILIYMVNFFLFRLHVSRKREMCWSMEIVVGSQIYIMHFKMTITW